MNERSLTPGSSDQLTNLLAIFLFGSVFLLLGLIVLTAFLTADPSTGSPYGLLTNTWG